MNRSLASWILAAAVFSAPMLPSLAAETNSSPIRVVAFTPDLHSIVAEIGGQRVAVSSILPGPDDPHSAQIHAGHIRALRSAELLVCVGMGLEDSWLPEAVRRSGNPAIASGQGGWLDASAGVRAEPLQPSAEAPAGHVHEKGNPHYLLDPAEGLRTARLVRDRLSALRPQWKEEFERNFSAFQIRLARILAGPALAGREDAGKLIDLFSTGELRQFLIAARLQPGGWFQRVDPYRGTQVVGDHDMWSYFTRGCGITVRGHVEPSPGAAPAARHARDLANDMRDARVYLLLSAPYFNRRDAELVARLGLGRVVPLAHQTGARPGAETYLDMIDYNFRTLSEGLALLP